MAGASEPKRWTSEVGKHYHELTEKERGQMNELRKRCADVLSSDHDDLFLLRFCRARDFKMDKVETMLREALQFHADRDLTWRSFEREFKADRKNLVFPQPRVNQRYGACRIHGVDREGSPVIWAFVGRRDNIGLMKSMSADDWSRRVAYFTMSLHEWQTRTAPEGIECEQATWIFDVSKLSLKQMLFMPFVRADQSAIWFVQNCQPEKLKKVYVINAPKAFTLVWACYKIFIDKKTRDKVSILGSNFMGEVTKQVDADQIPKFMGGTGSDEPTLPDAFSKTVSDDGIVTPAPLDDPFILAGSIPEEFYRAEVDKESMKELSVGAKATEDVPQEVTEVGSLVKWQYQSKGYDISFGLVFKPPEGGPEQELIKVARVDADVCTQKGEWEASKPGLYCLRFDNSYSRFRGKTVEYSLSVIAPSTEEDGEEEGEEESGGSLRKVSKVSMSPSPRRGRPSRPLPQVHYPEGRRVYVI